MGGDARAVGCCRVLETGCKVAAEGREAAAAEPGLGLGLVGATGTGGRGAV